jgi:hypothetical protein
MSKKNTILKESIEEELIPIKKELAERELEIKAALKVLGKSKASAAVTRAVKRIKGKQVTGADKFINSTEIIAAFDAVLAEIEEIAKLKRKLRKLEDKLILLR